MRRSRSEGYFWCNYCNVLRHFDSFCKALRVEGKSKDFALIRLEFGLPDPNLVGQSLTLKRLSAFLAIFWWYPSFSSFGGLRKWTISGFRMASWTHIKSARKARCTSHLQAKWYPRCRSFKISSSIRSCLGVSCASIWRGCKFWRRSAEMVELLFVMSCGHCIFIYMVCIDGMLQYAAYNQHVLSCSRISDMSAREPQRRSLACLSTLACFKSQWNTTLRSGRDLCTWRIVSVTTNGHITAPIDLCRCNSSLKWAGRSQQTLRKHMHDNEIRCDIRMYI